MEFFKFKDSDIILQAVFSRTITMVLLESTLKKKEIAKFSGKIDNLEPTIFKKGYALGGYKERWRGK